MTAKFMINDLLLHDSKNATEAVLFYYPDEIRVARHIEINDGTIAQQLDRYVTVFQALRQVQRELETSNAAITELCGQKRLNELLKQSY